MEDKSKKIIYSNKVKSSSNIESEDSHVKGMIFRGGSRAAATSKMEHFVIMVNGWKPLTIITKSSILDVAAVLDPPLVLNFSESNIPQKYYTILSIALEYKIAKERLLLSDIISGIKDAAKNISSGYMANSFRVECLDVLKKERPKNHINFNERLCRDIRKWFNPLTTNVPII